MVTYINWGGGDPLCTLHVHRAEGLHGWVRCRGYMREIPYTKINQVDTSHTVQGRAPLGILTVWPGSEENPEATFLANQTLE